LGNPSDQACLHGSAGPWAATVSKPERETVDALRKAADWVDGEGWRSVEYYGSW